MKKNHTLRFRVTKQQRERIKEETGLKGFATIAAYLHYLAFQRSQEVEKKINMIYTKLKQVTR